MEAPVARFRFRVHRPYAVDQAHALEPFQVRAQLLRVAASADPVGDVAQLGAAVGDGGQDAGVPLDVPEFRLEQHGRLVH